MINEASRFSQNRKKTMTDHSRDFHSREFELDPFVSQLSRWIDKEVTTKRTEFAAICLAERLARICIDLQERGIAVRMNTGVASAWITFDAIDLRIGGAKVSNNDKFTITKRSDLALLDQFQKAVNKHLERRLASMLETEEAFFQLYNMGILMIATTDPDGHYRWDLTDEGRRAGAEIFD
jgi:hypothetical protein